MHFNICSGLLALSATHVLAKSRHSVGGCPEPHDEIRSIAKSFNENKADAKEPGTIQVKTFVHIVTNEADSSDYDQAIVDLQMDVMNNAYNPYGISFTLEDTDFTVNDEWASAESSSDAELSMKSTLRRGGYGDLNLYFLSDLGGDLLGICYFPETLKNSTDTLRLDGCMVLAGTMPGGSTENYDEGKTAVHEVGHWFGLFHTFQGSSCSGSGDDIQDTPAQMTSTNGCPKNKNSCPGQPGLDDINNYMDYSYDSCYLHFTPDQRLRAHRMYQHYRAPYTGASPTYSNSTIHAGWRLPLNRLRVPSA